MFHRLWSLSSNTLELARKKQIWRLWPREAITSSVISNMIGRLIQRLELIHERNLSCHFETDILDQIMIELVPFSDATNNIYYNLINYIT